MQKVELEKKIAQAKIEKETTDKEFKNLKEISTAKENFTKVFVANEKGIIYSSSNKFATAIYNAGSYQIVYNLTINEGAVNLPLILGTSIPAAIIFIGAVALIIVSKKKHKKIRFKKTNQNKKSLILGLQPFKRFVGQRLPVYRRFGTSHIVFEGAKPIDRT